MMGCPEGWVETPLKRVLTYLDDRVQLDDMSQYITITVKRRHGGLEGREKLFGHQIKTKKQFRLIPGAFIISRIQCWHQAFAMVPEDVPANMIASMNYDQFEISPAVDRRFFWWLSHSPLFAETVRSSAVGVVIEKMVFDRDAWLQKSIPLPPLREQRWIVARIEELAAKIEEAKGLRKKAVEEVEAMLKSSMSAVFANPEWALLSVTEFCEQPQYGYTESATSEPVGPKFLRITDIQNGRVEWDKVPYCVCPDPEKYLLKKDDIVFARTGGTTGKSFLIGDCPPAVFASYLIRLRVRDRLSPEYLYSYFQSPSYWTQVLDERKGTGQPNVNGEKLAQIKVPIPSLDEQRRIVAYLDDQQSKVDALKRLQEETAEELDALLPSILDKAFKGEL